MKLNQLKRLAIRILLNRHAPRILIAILSAIAAAIVTWTHNYPQTVEIGRIILGDPEFTPTPAGVFALLFTLSAWILTRLRDRYRTKLIQSGLGNLFLDGYPGPKTFKRAIQAQLRASGNNAEADAIDQLPIKNLLEKFIPDPPKIPTFRPSEIQPATTENG